MPKEIESRKESCVDCRYYLADPEVEPDEVIEAAKQGENMLTGFCRRYPPVILLSYPEPIRLHPDVAGDTDWCGEFTPKL